MSENRAKQVEEIGVLESIYEDEWYTIDEEDRNYGITLTESKNSNKYHVAMEVKLSPEYPETAPPMYTLSIPWISKEKRQQVDNELSDLYIENKGEPVLFLWIDKLKEILSDYVADIDTPEEEEEDTELYDRVDDTHSWPGQVNPPESNAIKCPEIFHGEPLHDRKSKFQAHLAQVFYKEQVKMVLDKLCENKKIAAATHNIYAFRIYREEEGKRPLINQGCEDDGEIHAGNRMLHLLQIIDCQNVIVVVTRWYGGVHLGPDRFKHINSLTRNILEEYGHIKEKPKDKKSPKKK